MSIKSFVSSRVKGLCYPKLSEPSNTVLIVTKKRTVSVNVWLGTFCKPTFGNFDETRRGRVRGKKMAHFRENSSERSAGGPGTEQNFRFRFMLAGSSLPMWPGALAVWDCRTPQKLLLFLSLFSYVIFFEIVDFYSINFVFSSMFSRLLQNHRSLPCTVSWESLKKVYFVRRK